MRRVLFFLAFVTLLAPWTFAQGEPGTVELTPTAGYWFGDTLAKGTTGAFPFDVTIDDAPGYGARLAYRFAPNWALEGFLARTRADLVTGSDQLFGGRTKIGDIDLTTGELSIEGSFGKSRLVPFFAGGVGAMRLDPKVAGTSADTRFVGNIGGGFKLFFTPQVALRLDARWHSVEVGNNSYHDCYRHNDWNCYNNDWISFFELGLGLTFVF
jgi:hypothetical protein